MWVIDVVAIPPKLRGALARWTVEVRPGLYVGNTSAKFRDLVWEMVREGCPIDGSAAMAMDARTSQGFEVRTTGQNRRDVVDWDGLLLARWSPKVDDEPPDTCDGINDDWDVDDEYLEP